MPRNMSFFMTTQQVIDRKKDVTRRERWRFVKAGDLICAVRKCQGLKPGEKIERLAMIRVISARFEPLAMLVSDRDYGRREMEREGFPGRDPADFVAMLCQHYKCDPTTAFNRIEFEYVA